MRDWDVWQRHKDYNTVIALACEIPGETIGLLEKAGFIVDDGSKPPVKADQLFILHIRDLNKKHYWGKFEQFKDKYGEDPKPVHLEEMTELVIRFLGDVSTDQSISIANYALKTLLSGR